MNIRRLGVGLAAVALMLTGCSAPSTYDGYGHGECAATTTNADGNKVTNCSWTEMPVPTQTVTETVTAAPSETSTPTPTQTATVTKINDSAFTYTGATWQTTTGNSMLFNGDNHFSNVVGAKWSFKFNGSKVQWYGEKNSALGIVGVTLDAQPEVLIDPYASSRSEQNLLYTSPAEMTQGEHTITVRITGQKNAASSGTYASADRVDVTSFSEATATPTPTPTQTSQPAVPAFDKIVVAVFENTWAESINGGSSAPYLKSLGVSGANLTNMHGVTHPSFPNYLALYTGSTYGRTTNDCVFLDGTTLADQLMARGKSFIGYAESLPSNGWTGCISADSQYKSKHAPWVAMKEAELGHQFTEFPKTDFASLPNVSFVIPNMCNSMHDCSISTGDNWAKNNLEAYRQWAVANNSLLVITFDEDDAQHSNLIYTTFSGAHVRPGNTSLGDNLYSILGMIEDSQGLPRMGNSVGKGSLAGIFQ